jgi:hypothetical protein
MILAEKINKSWKVVRIIDQQMKMVTGCLTLAESVDTIIHVAT